MHLTNIACPTINQKNGRAGFKQAKMKKVKAILVTDSQKSEFVKLKIQEAQAKNKLLLWESDQDAIEPLCNLQVGDSIVAAHNERICLFERQLDMVLVFTLNIKADVYAAAFQISELY